MVAARVDPALAAAESALERVAPGSRDGQDDAQDAGDELDLHDTVGFHIQADRTDPPQGDDELDWDARQEVHPDPDRSVCVDALAEAFNARDLDALLDLVTPDCETPGLANDLDDFALAMEDLWLRRPTCLVTRGEHGDDVIGVLWELADAGRWWRVASVHVEDVADGLAGVIEFSDDPFLVEEIAADEPDLDLEQGSRWAEWEDGDSA